MFKKILTIVILSITVLVLKINADENIKNSYALIGLKGSVNPIVSEYIVNSIEKANIDKNQFIILTQDTPGGLMSAMREIISAILNSKIPVIVYTYPKGAQAASAGGFIMLAADINAMAPGTEIGAMHPVSPFIKFTKDDKNKSGKSEKDVMSMKILNDTVAYAKGLAQKRGRNVKWAEDAVRNAISSSYLEAKKARVVDLIAEDLDDLLMQIHNKKIKFNKKQFIFKTKSIIQKEYRMHWKENFLNFFADPQVVFFLFIIAVIGIGLEVKNPGLIVPGVIGALSLFMFLMAVRILPINFAGLFLVVLAIVLFILELNITSYGLLTIGGLISFVLGSMILFDSPLPGFSVPIHSILASLIFILIILFFVVRSVIDAHSAKIATGKQGLIGEVGRVINSFSKEGKVMVHGEVWSAQADEKLERDDEIVVTDVKGMKLCVKKQK